ncbi:Oxygen regulatory protein NreC [Streptomyces sp. ADI96-02]|nr:Oxygen regulatory protein NreC [Streptomyces sp. ADI96-02]
MEETAVISMTERPVLDFAMLTERELEVLVLLASGEQNRWLARRLGIAERTVRAHTTSIVRKLNLKSRFEAAIVSHLYAEDIRGLRP